MLGFFIEFRLEEALPSILRSLYPFPETSGIGDHDDISDEADEAEGEGGTIKVELAMIEEAVAAASNGPNLWVDGTVKSTLASACAEEGVTFKNTWVPIGGRLVSF